MPKKKKKNHTHKTVFTWFSNLHISTELQRFHYYQGKITKCGYSFSFSQEQQQQQNPNHQKTVSISCAQYSQWATKRAKNISAWATPWTKSQKISH